MADVSNTHKTEIVEKELRGAFLIGVALKGVDALIEAALGVLLMYTHVVTNTIIALTNYALIEDPDNFFATHLRALADVSSHAQFFGGLYLFAHGMIKAVLMLGLWRDKMWAYPASIAVILLFLIYEVVRFLETYSVALLALIIFDSVIVILIAHEYHHKRRRMRAART